MKVYKIKNNFEDFFSFSVSNVELFSKMPVFTPKFKAKPRSADWVKPDVEFYQSDNYSASGVHIPDITTWLLGNLVLNGDAYKKLNSSLKGYGEFLDANCEGIDYYIFNTLNVLPDEFIDQANTVETIESGIYMGLEKLAFNEFDSDKYMLFKTTADKLVNTYCTEKYVNLVEAAGLDGLRFDEV